MDLPAKPRHINYKKGLKKVPLIKPKSKLFTNNNANLAKDPVEVYCRLRPVKSPNEPLCIKRINNTTLQLIPFSNNKLDLFYSFKYVFQEDTTQKEIFDRIASPMIEDVINGKNGLLFTYGITSSGKTHTITGNPQDSGILPRTLDVLFNSIEKNMSRKFVFKSDGQNYFEIRSTPDALLEWQKEKQVIRTPSSITKTPRTKRKEIDELKEWEQRQKDEDKLNIEHTENGFAVFASYVEIYNNYIYDLLDDSVIDQIRMKQPQSKVLREDNKRQVFVYGANEVEVKTADEAFDLFIKGVRRRRIAHTALNTESSRSHSVFNLRVVQAPMDSGGEIIQDEKYMVISQLALVDLAGSERTYRTNNTGERLREAGNINNSLMALRNCIDILRENQRTNANKIVPYRDNKLTHLFKSYFEGEGKIKMIICVNPGSEDFDETLHVMKFAETTQEVLVNRANNIGYNFRVPFTQSLPKIISSMATDFTNIDKLSPSLPSFEAFDHRDENQISNWINIFEQRKKNRKRKGEELQLALSSFRETLTQIENEKMVLKQQLDIWKNDHDAREHMNKLLESKCSKFERCIEADKRKINELEKDLKQAQRSLEEKERALNIAEVEQERDKTKIRERMNLEKERMKRIFERMLEEKQVQLEKEQCLTKEKMHLVKEILSANNSDWNFFRDYWESLTHNINHGSDNFLSPSNVHTPSKPTNLFGVSLASTAEARTQSSVPSSATKPMKTRSEHDLVFKSTPISERHHDLALRCFSSPKTKGIPTSNPKHLRSLSSGTEKWIDHRPENALELGTVFKPKIKNKKSLTNLKNIGAEDLKSAYKYALTHHEANENGEVETHIYKGKVIPSIGGGAQIIFNDVETLKQTSPSKSFLE